MKKTINKVFFAAFFTLWCVITVANAVKKPITFSENESRYLAEFPSFSWNKLIEGDFMRAIDDYFNDQFIKRDQWISVQSVTEYALGKRETNGVYFGKNRLLPKIALPDSAVISANIKGINDFTARTGLASYLMLVPSAGAVQPQNLPLFAHDWGEEQTIADITARTQGVSSVDAVQILNQNTDKTLYYGTDHHWTQYGAYLAYTQFCAAAGITPQPYIASIISCDFNGTLYSKSGARFVPGDSIEAFQTPYDGGCDILDGDRLTHYDSIYFPEYLNKKDKYAYFLGTNKPLVTIYSTNHTGKSLLMFKDSYAHCFAPLLLSEYDKITLVDLRYVNGKLADIVNSSDYDAVLHLYSVDTFVHQNSSRKLSES